MDICDHCGEVVRAGDDCSDPGGSQAAWCRDCLESEADRHLDARERRRRRGDYRWARLAERRPG